MWFKKKPEPRPSFPIAGYSLNMTLRRWWSPPQVVASRVRSHGPAVCWGNDLPCSNGRVCRQAVEPHLGCRLRQAI